MTTVTQSGSPAQHDDGLAAQRRCCSMCKGWTVLTITITAKLLHSQQHWMCKYLGLGFVIGQLITFSIINSSHRHPHLRLAVVATLVKSSSILRRQAHPFVDRFLYARRVRCSYASLRHLRFSTVPASKPHHYLGSVDYFVRLCPLCDASLSCMCFTNRRVCVCGKTYHRI